ncbi:flagellar protein FliT [Fervidibacillus halotolerans]|uniref:Flagellar protein FliT n=1 Tax=Fervidibacillus halotolerans TaxID=2980027 RepID=A0A9E8RWQ9_9BACI|nr:flagellar protein FliT [Fervidibacillus halotolerans]WAA12015.1 flagellar protein FliT [Fervidibacillus halotolerans]
MNPLKQFYLLTAELIRLLEESDANHRDETIQRMNELFEKREEVLKQIAPPFSRGEKQLAEQVMKLNEKLVRLMSEEKNNIRSELEKVRQQKKVQQKYVNPYAQLQTDGIFYDKKK